MVLWEQHLVCMEEQSQNIIFEKSGNSYFNFEGDVPHVCGGYSGGYLNKCWKYEGMNDQWIEAST